MGDGNNMRRIAIINQKGGVGKTTTVANLGAALARAGKRVVVFDMDPQANLSLYLGSEVGRGDASVYGVLTEGLPVVEALRKTKVEGLSLVASHLDLSGAELELASAMSRETLLRDAINLWEAEAIEKDGFPPADYVLLDCPPSLGLLSINALVAAEEVMITVQTEFFALQGLSKLVEVIQLLRRRMNPALTLTGILPCLYDSRLKLAREVLAELRRFFPGKVYPTPVRTNVR
ncbi:MAG: chromosome partitioning protein, partial [Planctomycetota bacterium]